MIFAIYSNRFPKGVLGSGFVILFRCWYYMGRVRHS